MPVMQREVSVAANSVNENIFSGSAFEFAQGNRLVSLGVCAAATGIEITILNGSDILLEETPAPILTRYPIIPDEMYYTDASVVGDRLVVRARNTTGGALVVRAVCQITNL